MPDRREKVEGPGGEPLDAEIVPISAFQEGIATYLLADGSSLSVRTVVTRVFRLLGLYGSGGTPLYTLRAEHLIEVDAPDHSKESES